MPYIEMQTPDEGEYPWWAAARWLDDGSPALLYEHFIAQRAAAALPSEFAGVIKRKTPARETDHGSAHARAAAEPRFVIGLGRLMSGLLARLSGERAAV